MTQWPKVGHDPLVLPALAGPGDGLWPALIELSELRPGDWTLVGGQMVFLHAIEHGVEPPRVSTDLDVQDPFELAEQLTKKGRQRLRHRSEMVEPDHPAWFSLPAGLADRGRAAYRLLVG